MTYLNFDDWPGGTPGFILIMAWSLFWKGLALWHSSKRDEKRWFIALLILNTFGILDIIYLFYFVKLKIRKPKPGEGVL
jgi:hypothetical protein